MEDGEHARYDGIGSCRLHCHVDDNDGGHDVAVACSHRFHVSPGDSQSVYRRNPRSSHCLVCHRLPADMGAFWRDRLPCLLVYNPFIGNISGDVDMGHRRGPVVMWSLSVYAL